MTEAELYKELGALTKDKGRWKESISYVCLPSIRAGHSSSDRVLS